MSQTYGKIIPSFIWTNLSVMRSSSRSHLPPILHKDGALQERPIQDLPNRPSRILQKIGVVNFSWNSLPWSSPSTGLNGCDVSNFLGKGARQSSRPRPDVQYPKGGVDFNFIEQDHLICRHKYPLTSADMGLFFPHRLLMKISWSPLSATFLGMTILVSPRSFSLCRSLGRSRREPAL